MENIKIEQEAAPKRFRSTMHLHFCKIRSWERIVILDI